MIEWAVVAAIVVSFGSSAWVLHRTMAENRELRLQNERLIARLGDDLGFQTRLSAHPQSHTLPISPLTQAQTPMFRLRRAPLTPRKDV